MKSGFTLIELLVVVLIIGILSSVALPQYSKAVKKARATEAIVNTKALADALNVYYMANGSYEDVWQTVCIDSLDVSLPESLNFEWFIGCGPCQLGDFKVRNAAWAKLREGGVVKNADFSVCVEQGSISRRICWGRECKEYVSCKGELNDIGTGAAYESGCEF